MHPRRKRNIFKPVIAPYDYVFEFPAEEKCITITTQQIAMLVSIMDFLSWPTRWYSETSQPVDMDGVDALLGDLHKRLIQAKDCTTGQPLPPMSQPELPDFPPLYGLSDIEIEDLFEEYCMSCNCLKDLAKLLRINSEGVLQVWSQSDNCGCMDWVSVGVISGAAGGAVGSAITGGLIDAQGNPIGGAIIPLKPPSTNVSQRTLRLCAKATQMVDIFIMMMETAIYADSIIDDIDDLLPFDFRATYNAVNQYLAGLGVPSASFVFGDVVIQAVRSMQNLAMNQFIAWIANKGVNRENAICILARDFEDTDEITGQTILDAVIALDLAVEAYAAFITLLQGFEIAGIKELFDTYAGDVDCGCPEIANIAAGAGASDSDPETFDWVQEIDLTLASNIAPAVTGGTGTGIRQFNSNIPAARDAWDAGQGFVSALISNSDPWAFGSECYAPNQGRTIVKVAWYVEGYSAGESDPTAADGGVLLVALQNYQGGSYANVIPPKTPGNGWFSAEGYWTTPELRVYLRVGTEKDEAPSPTGSGRITKAKFWGLGSNPYA